MPPQSPVEPTVPRYRPLSVRRRVLLVGLAAATAIAVVLMLLDPPGGLQRQRPAPPPCTDGQTERCIGGKAEVIVPATGASAPR